MIGCPGSWFGGAGKSHETVGAERGRGFRILDGGGSWWSGIAPRSSCSKEQENELSYTSKKTKEIKKKIETYPPWGSRAE